MVMTATTLTDRAVIRLSGEDVRGFLQGLVTNDVTDTLPVWAGLLTPQGKCLFDFLVWADGEDLLLDCEAEAADDLVKRHRRVLTDHGKRGTGTDRQNDGHNGRTGSKTHRVLLLDFTLVGRAPERVQERPVAGPFYRLFA